MAKSMGGGENSSRKGIKSEPKSKKVKSTSKTNDTDVWMTVLQWVGIGAILIGLGSGLLYMFLSYWVVLIIVAIGVAFILAAEKLPEMKSNFTASNQSQNIAIIIYAVSALIIFPFFFHGVEIELFKKSSIRTTTEYNLESVEKLISEYKKDKEAKLKGYEQRLNTFIANYERGDATAMDSIVSISEYVHIDSKIIREYKFERTSDVISFKDKFKKNYNDLFKETDLGVRDFEYLSLDVRKELKKLFVIGLPDSDEEIEITTSLLYPLIKKDFPNSVAPDFVINYPLRNPLKSFAEASALQTITVLILYLAFNLAILLDFFLTSGSYRGRTKF